MKRLVADRHPRAARVDMAVVVFDLLERAAIDHGLIAFEAGALFALVSHDGHRSELDAFDRAPRVTLPFDDLDAMKASFFKCRQELVFAERTRDAARPKLRVAL